LNNKLHGNNHRNEDNLKKNIQDEMRSITPAEFLRATANSGRYTPCGTEGCGLAGVGGTLLATLTLRSRVCE
jgi:hypothetical protein